MPFEPPTVAKPPDLWVNLPGPSVELQVIPQFMSLVHCSLQKFTVAPRTDSAVIDRFQHLGAVLVSMEDSTLKMWLAN